ncbi:hypothetical protein BGZ61DRAFT_377057, partial [Ilyonectria robusta]|uniref:uncharacterized protein n=1 Tax=Ilyonectria robusta TaxID=1079257 RepID=UPI001E8CCEF8
QENYSFLSDQQIACLDGQHRLRAATKNSTLSWWVVGLFCIQCNWLDFQRRLMPRQVDDQAIQDEVESTSHRTRYSGAEGIAY